MQTRANHLIGRCLRIAAASAALACIVLAVCVLRHRQPITHKHDSGPRYNAIAQVYARNTDPRVRYVGDAACQSCHPRISAAYRQHPMARSLRRVSEAGSETAARSSFEVNGLRFEVKSRGGRTIHATSRRATDGRILARSEAEVAFVVGAGKRGYSYLTEQDGFVFQSPITWYADRRSWGLSPHLTNALGSLERPVSVLCLFCHANHAQLVGGAANRYQPLFEGLDTPITKGKPGSPQPVTASHSSGGLAIGCERCHGPGELHVRQAQAGTLTTADDPIVNPARLPPGLRDAVCQQCHLKGAARVLRRGRQPFDYRPGLPLSDFWAVFVQPLDAGGASKFSSHVEQMDSSRCYQASQGRLGCISCHDAHELPPAATKVSYYRQRCLACHGDQSCSLSVAQRRQVQPDDSCIACHMPRRPNSNIAHMVSTDHRILRRPGAERASTRLFARFPADGVNLVLFHEGQAQAPDEDFARDRGVALMDLAGLPQMEGSRRRLALAARRWLEAAVREDPNDVSAQQAYGYALWLLGRPEGAWAAFGAALAREPEREETLMFAAGLREQMGRPDEALELWQRVRRVNPRSTRAAVEMARLYVAQHAWPEARAACDAALNLDPFRDMARQLHIMCSLRTGHQTEARMEFDKLLRVRPEKEKALRAWFAGEQGAGP